MSTPDWKQKLEQDTVKPHDLNVSELKDALEAVTDDGDWEFYRRKPLIKKAAIDRGLVDEGELVDLEQPL